MDYRSIALPEHGTMLYESKHRGRDLVNEHYHDIYQILYAIEGEGCIHLDGKEHALSQDHAVWILPYSKHSIRSDSSLTLLVLAFDAGQFEPFVRDRLIPEHFSASTVFRPHPFAAGEVRQLLRKMLFEQSHDDPLSRFAVRVYLLELLTSLARIRQTLQPFEMNQVRADRIRAYIDDHYYEPLSARQLADRMNISVRYMDTIFKEQYRMTPLQYLAEVRMERAKELLAGTDKDIASICFEIGYENLSTFYRVFKNMVSLSPHKYRLACQEGNQP